MININVVADSSFYICFIDDINQPDKLLKILADKNLLFRAGRIIHTEISKAFNRANIFNILENTIQKFHYHKFGEILRSLFSEEEIEKGETEVIVIAYVLEFQKKDFLFIIDDGDGRKYVRDNFQDLVPKLKGTVGFISFCYCNFDIFNQNETIIIINDINESKFRVTKEVVINAINEIKCCKNA